MTNHNPAFTSSAATGGFTETANTSADGGTTEIALAVLPRRRDASTARLAHRLSSSARTPDRHGRPCSRHVGVGACTRGP